MRARKVHQEDLGRGPAHGAAAPRGREPAAAVRNVQRMAGNRAVGGIVARFQAVEHEESRRALATLELEKLGTLELESFSFAERGNELHVTFRVDPLTPKLMQAAALGRAIASARLVASTRFTMRDVIVSSVQLGGASAGDAPLATATFSFANLELEGATAE